MKRSLPLLVMIVMVVSAGAVHGRWTNRWGKSPGLRLALERLGRVPTTIGGWRAEAGELGRGVAEAAEIDGYLSRRYVHRESGESVSVLLVCGRPGPIAVHSPDVCYPAQGYDSVGDPSVITFESADGPKADRFMAGAFVKQEPTGPTALRIFWSFRADKGWDVPGDPRRVFAPRSALYKLYVVAGLKTPDPRVAGGEVAARFLREALLPELEKALGGA